jgi:hypothetical protein
VGKGGAIERDLLAGAEAELYTADPDRFTQRRAELVAQAREAGQGDAAKRIAGLRKPTRSAWAVNRLVRTDPQARARLAELSAELRDGEHYAGRIRELTAARSRLVDELTRQALAGIPAPPASLREEVTATLDAALADPEVAAGLGTLVRAAQWAGFGMDPMTPLPPAEKKTKTPAPAEAAEERARRHREKILLAERAVVEADEEAEAASLAERDLEDTVRRLEAELSDTRRQLAEARRRSYRAVTGQRRAAAELGRLGQTE